MSNDKFRYGGASGIGDMVRQGGDVSANLTDGDLKTRGAGFWQDMAKQGGAVVGLAISGSPVTTGTINVAYAGFSASASGGQGPYVYSLVGTWPAGISVNSGNGAVSGTPTESGTFPNLSVRATDAHTNTADLDVFTLTISA